eukprot:1744006-Prymnesium_polylepis.1
MAESTSAARQAGRESVAILDNLHGHTTEAHLANLAGNHCKRHLLPGNTTDELQLIDAGVGHALKSEMAHLHDEWLSKDDNLELWTAATDFPAWRKRALVTWLAAQAWERVCSRFDFEAAAARLGMRMTIDGSGDELIRIQGTEHYSFSDEDGGDSGCESDEDDGETVDELEGGPQDNADISQLQEDVRGRLKDHEEHVSLEMMRAQHDDETATSRRPLAHHTDETGQQLVTKGPTPSYGDEEATENLTTTHCVTSRLSRAVAPPGYTMVDVCPPLDTSHHQQSLIGKVILYGWEDAARTGWVVGRVVRNRVTARDQREVPTATHVV